MKAKDEYTERLIRKDRQKYPELYHYRDLMKSLRDTYENRLYPCKICGGDAILLDNMTVRVEYGSHGNVVRKDVIGGDEVWAYCKGCGAATATFVSTGTDESKEFAMKKATEAWNARQEELE